MSTKTRFEEEAKGNSEMAYAYCVLTTEGHGKDSIILIIYN